MNDYGKPLFFDIEKYLDVVEGMINSDEVERALWMLENPPAFYRDNIPPRLTEIKTNLMKNLVTPCQYNELFRPECLDVSVIMDQWPIRAQLLDHLIVDANQRNISPHIMEIAPGTGWMFAGLDALKRRFTHEFIAINERHLTKEESELNIFVAFELIEHLSNEFEIYQNYLKFGKTANVIMLSTPLYTVNGGEDNWASRSLGHLRTYTPKEFLAIADKLFPGKKWDLFSMDTMVVIGQ